MPLSKVARCLRLHQLLNSQVQFSIEQLATLQRVSRRTVFRDLRLLEAAVDELKVDYPPGEHPGPLCPPHQPSLTMEETMALMLSAKVSPLNSVPELSTPLHSALAKLVGQVPKLKRGGLARLANACQLREAPIALTDSQSKTLICVFEALRTERCLQLEIDGRPPFRTRFRPERLTASKSTWLMGGRSTWHRRRVEVDLQSVNRAVILNN